MLTNTKTYMEKDIHIRIDERMKDLLIQISHKNHMNLSTYVRRMIFLLHEDEYKKQSLV